MRKLEDYLGDWKCESKADGPLFLDLKIEKTGPDQVSITRAGRATYKFSPANTDPGTHLVPYADTELETQLKATTVAKFVRGKLVTSHIWEDINDGFIGVGMRVMQIGDDGRMVKKAAGITLQSIELTERSSDPGDPLFEVDGTDTAISWKADVVFTKL